MSQTGSRRAYQYGSQAGASGGGGGGSTINQKAALASAYQELGKELASSKLKMVGNYTLQRPIGEGTFGKVRLGLHRLTNTRVAIKQIPKAHSASLTREIHHHRRLHHPHVMQLYEVIATEQYIWMVSELCAGGELYDYLVENEVLAEPEARRIFGQLCLAVAYVHSKGIVHRDLKLENILLDERCNVKLGDFGFTREFERKRLMETFCGTTGYAAPEMLAGKKYTGEEVDIWSLGVILYALLCGALPFDDDDESVMKEKILRGDYEIPDCLSEEARDLVTAVLQQDPTKRPSIRSILAHPWFTKMMAQSPMSTVEEDANAIDYFDSRPLPQSTHPTESASANQPSESLHATTSASNSATAHLAPTTDVTDQAPPSHVQALHHHQVSASGISERSYHSTRSDSESSDRRSSNTDLTDPTTADSLSRTDEIGGTDESTANTLDSTHTSSSLEPASTSAAAFALPSKQAIGLHRNESQTTIKRLSSNGSDASLGAISRQPTKSTSTSLPTHHELPAGSDDKSDDVIMPMYQSVPLTKRGSQGSSRGHHRTPSRTKRRSLSSSGLSDHHPPQLGRKPVDYIAQLANLQPATFSTAVEQNLLHQLSTLGMDVGQMVHSIVTDACDASGAMWWMLLRKAKDRPAEQLPASSSAPESVNTTSQLPSLTAPTPAYISEAGASSQVDGPPPPVPTRDPARNVEDGVNRSSLVASKSENSGLAEGGYRRLQTVVSHEELGPPAPPSLHASASEALIGTSIAARDPDRSLPSTPESRPKSQHRHTTAVASPSKLQQVASSLVGGSPTSEAAKGRRSSHTERPRSNSLSVKQFAQSVLGSKGSSTPPPVPAPNQVIVAGEALPLERAKSPTLFGRRNTISNVKDSMVGRLSNPSTPKKAPAEIADKSRRGSGKKSIETDIDRLKALEFSTDSIASSPSRSEPAPPQASTSSSSIPISVADKKEGTVPSISQDSFSTMSGTPQGSEKSAARGKPGSSFIATVRTWLGGANEKPSKKGKAGKKRAGSAGLGIDNGSGLGRSPLGTVAGPGSAPTLAPSRTPSMRHRSGHYQQTSVTRRGGPRSPHLGSMSRRSSTGSSHHPHLDLPPNSFAHSMSRPGNARRISGGSITPTGTYYGDYINELPSRPSRPSSSHSLAHSSTAPRPGLHGKAGSTGSASSVYRAGHAGSVYSTGSGRRHPRPSHDGGTTVRRHRTYASSSGSPSRHNSFRHDSRPSSIKSRASSPGRTMTGLSELDADADVDGDAGTSMARRSTRSTPRHSLDQRSISDARKNGDSLEPVHAQHHHVVAQSIFVAHKTRSPYRPPSANPHLYGTIGRGASHNDGKANASGQDSSGSAATSDSTGLPATGTGTWRHSWGRPPPCWAGPVDPPPLNDGTGRGARGAGTADFDGNKIKLRDVFAHREDDDWTDEDEEPSYSGGLGQMGSLPSMSSNISRGGPASSSPYATRNFAALGSSLDSNQSASANAFRGAAPFSSRYAGVRNIFQPQTQTGSYRSHQQVQLSLGNEFAPKLLSTTLHSPTKSSPTGGSLASLGEVATSVPGNAASANASKAESTGQQAQSQQGGGGSRITQSFHKPVQIIEEEEEDE